MNPEKLSFRHTGKKDYQLIEKVLNESFTLDEEATLALNLLHDKSAFPLVSILAFYNDTAVGHILFTRSYLNGQDKPLIHILAPLAVVPDFQGKGIGGMLVTKGIQQLNTLGSKLVFVLGHIEYYPKYGFLTNAGKYGFQAPYRIPEEVEDAWMVQELQGNCIEKYRGLIKCADMLMKPEYWQE